MDDYIDMHGCWDPNAIDNADTHKQDVAQSTGKIKSHACFAVKEA